MDRSAGRDHPHIDLLLPCETHARDETSPKVDQRAVGFGKMGIRIEHQLSLALQAKEKRSELLLVKGAALPGTVSPAMPAKNSDAQEINSGSYKPERIVPSR